MTPPADRKRCVLVSPTGSSTAEFGAVVPALPWEDPAEEGIAVEEDARRFRS